jgi:serine/threonine protein kinase
MKDLKHPNILECYCAMNSKNNCYIVTDYCQNGDLERYLKVNGALDEQTTARIAYDVFKGLEYLNKMEIVHRDLKVANIFLRDDGVAKIGDFGFAVKARSNIKDISVGSPIYMSP